MGVPRPTAVSSHFMWIANAPLPSTTPSLRKRRGIVGWHVEAAAGTKVKLRSRSSKAHIARMNFSIALPLWDTLVPTLVRQELLTEEHFPESPLNKADNGSGMEWLTYRYYSPSTALPRSELTLREYPLHSDSDADSKILKVILESTLRS